jgi:hypothetical protein
MFMVQKMFICVSLEDDDEFVASSVTNQTLRPAFLAVLSGQVGCGRPDDDVAVVAPLPVGSCQFEPVLSKL